MKKTLRKNLIYFSVFVLMLTAFAVCAFGADIESDISSGKYGAPVDVGDCYNASGNTYNAKWSIYKSSTSGKYIIYFSLDTSVSQNTELVLGFDPSKNSGKGGIVGGWGANLTSSKYPWSSYHSNIDTLVIGNGITKLASPFYDAGSLKSIEFPSSLTALCVQALMNCRAVEKAYTRGNTPKSYVFEAENVKYLKGFSFAGLAKIKSFEFSDDFTISGTNIFDGCKSLTSFIVPSSVNALTSKIFCNCTSLEKVTFLGNTEVPYVSSATTKDEATVDKDGNAFAGCTALKTIEAFPDTNAYAFAGKFGIETNIPAFGVYSGTTEDGAANFKVDLETGALVISKNSGYDTLNVADEALQKALRLCSDKIKTAEIDNFTKLSFSMTDTQRTADEDGEEEIYFNLFAYLTSLEKVHFSGSSIEVSVADYGKGLFEGANSLKTVWFGSNYDENTVDISKITLSASEYPQNFAVNLFAGCSSMANVNLPTDTLFDTIESSTFAGCTSLTEIYLPENVTSIGARAFKGCHALKTAYIMNDSCTYIASGNDASFESTTEVKNIYIPKLASALKLDGFSIRCSEYNGLRGVFCFDNNGAAKKNINNGYTLIEYGAIVTSSKNKAAYGSKLTYNAETGSYDAKATGLVKRPVWQNGTYVDKILNISKEECDVDGATHFALAIIRYTSNYRDDIYMSGYEIWEYGGEKFIVYSDYESSDGSSEMKETNIYEVSLGMYKQGFVNTKQDIDGVIWDTLVAGGAVTLEKTSGYTVKDGLTDLDGNAFGDTFKALEIPFCTIDKGNAVTAGTNFTLLHDTNNSGNYVIVFRGDGNIPGCNIWGSTRMQYGTGWLSTSYYDAVAKSPNPTFTAEIANKIVYAIADHGITGLGNSMFANYTSNTKIETFVYPETLETIYGGFANAYVKTVFRAGTNKKYIEVGLYDLHYENLKIEGMSLNGNGNITKIHLPTNFKSISDYGVFNSLTKLERIWCSDTFDTGTAGILDFSGATGLTSIGTEAFINTVGAPAKTLRLPDSCTNISSDIFVQNGKENKCSITRVEQVTRNDSVAAVCEAGGIEYVNGNFN